LFEAFSRVSSFCFFGFFDTLEFFAGFEANGFAGRDVDFSAAAGIAADAGFARFDAEDAEAAEFDAQLGRIW
jgi:hypothetical protein